MIEILIPEHICMENLVRALLGTSGYNQDVKIKLHTLLFFFGKSITSYKSGGTEILIYIPHH